LAIGFSLGWFEDVDAKTDFTFSGWTFTQVRLAAALLVLIAVLAVVPLDLHA